MIIEDHRIVTISYEVREKDASGQILERAEVLSPFTFMFGVGQMLAGWERQLKGLKPGTGFTFTLPPEMAYGRSRTDLVYELSIDLFKNAAGEVDSKLLQKGQYLTFTNADGKANHAKVISFDEQKVKVDANHALAGKTLFFAGAVLNVREASVDELIQKRYLKDS